MELIKLIPSPSEFNLSSIGVPIYLSPCTLGRLMKLEQKYGKIEEVLKEASLESVAKIAFTLMTYESKGLFPLTEIETVDDDGKKITESVGGVNLLMQSISTTDEFKGMLIAVFKSFGMSNEKVDEVKKNMEQEVVTQELTGTLF